MNLVFGLMLSWHVDFCGDCKEIHPYVGLEFDTPSEHITLGLKAWINSEGRPGILAGTNWHIPNTPLSVQTGVGFGYSFADVVPMASLNLHINENASLFVMPTPTSFDGTFDEWSVVTGLNLKF